MRTPPAASTTQTRVARLLVMAQLVLVGLVLALPTRGGGGPVSPGRVAAGAGGAAAGSVVMVLAGTTLGRGLTAVPIPNEHARLHTGGLFRFVRHPIYSGLLLVTGSVAVASGDRRRLAAFTALLGLLTGKAHWEEKLLERRFPAYAAYAARTPRFVPGGLLPAGLWPARRGGSDGRGEQR